MKKIALPLSTLCLIMTATVFQNCNKNKNNVSAPMATEERNNMALQARNSRVSLLYDIMQFPSAEDLTQTIEELDSENETYVKDYIENTLGLKTTALDSIHPDTLEKLDLRLNTELNVYKVYEKFGKSMNFNSLISVFAPLQKDWMKNGGVDQDDPLITYPYPFAFQCVLNPYQEIKIGTSIFKFDPASESVYEVTDGDYQTILNLRKDLSSGNSKPNVTIYGKSLSCKTFKNSNKTKDYTRNGKNFRFKSYSGIASSYVNAITQNFRRYKSGALLWSSCKMSNTITADELYNNGNCNADMRTTSGVNGSDNAFRLEKLAFVLFYNPQTYKWYQGMNLHCPSHKTRTTSQIYNPYDYLSVYAW